MCDRCVELEKRIDLLTSFVWERLVSFKCIHRHGSTCVMLEDDCSKSDCDEFSWVHSGLAE